MTVFTWCRLQEIGFQIRRQNSSWEMLLWKELFLLTTTVANYNEVINLKVISTETRHYFATVIN